MQFPAWLETIAGASESQQNELTDGHWTVSYEALPTALAAFTSYFAAHGIDQRACMALECPNTVPGALTLLYLLQQGVSFVLLPPSEQGEAPSAWKPLPRFCQYRLAVKVGPAQPAQVAAQAQLPAPAEFLLLERNPHYQPPIDRALHAPGRLFLRTSGSMGAAKLVVHQQASLLDNAQNCVEKYGFTSADRCVIPVPLAHMYGLGAEFLPAILAGAAIDLQEKSNLLRYLAREKVFQPTIAFVTPTICDMLLKGFKRPRTNYKVIVTSGQRISEMLFRAFDERVNGCLVNQYGSSELGAIAACDPSDPLELKATTIGRPMAGVALRIDGEAAYLAITEEGSGELLCRHPYGFEGYVDEAGKWLYQRPSASWYPTGDLAKPVTANAIQVVGRAGNSINRRGYLVQFADIERQMEEIPAIAQVVVIRAAARPNSDPNADAPIAAICVVQPDEMVTSAQLRQHCFERLPPYAIPDEILIVERMPLLPSGKVDRQALVATTAAQRRLS